MNSDSMTWSATGAHRDRFAWVTSGLACGVDPLFDADLVGHELAAVIPTRGSLIPGWALVVPRLKALSMRDLPKPVRKNVLDLAFNIAKRNPMGGCLAVFEHGPVREESSLGCGVDQAHLHSVKLPFDLVQASICDDTIEWCAVDRDDPWQFVEGEYLLSLTETCAVAGKLKSAAQSQYFRKLIANQVGRPNEWDYKFHAGVENARLTRQLLG